MKTFLFLLTILLSPAVNAGTYSIGPVNGIYDNSKISAEFIRIQYTLNNAAAVYLEQTLGVPAEFPIDQTTGAFTYAFVSVNANPGDVFIMQAEACIRSVTVPAAPPLCSALSLPKAVVAPIIIMPPPSVDLGGASGTFSF